MSISWSPKHQTTRVSSNLLLPASLHLSFSRSGYFLEYPPFLCVTSIRNPRSHCPVPHCHHALPPSFLPLHPGCSADRPVCCDLETPDLCLFTFSSCKPVSTTISSAVASAGILLPLYGSTALGITKVSWWLLEVLSSMAPTHPGPPTSPIHPTSFSTPGQPPSLSMPIDSALPSANH